MEKSTSIDFEKSLAELEKLVTDLERGELSLEQSLAQFERGVKLARQCQGALQEAEQRVLKLTENTVKAPLELFAADDS